MNAGPMRAGSRLERVLRSGRFAVTAELDAPDSADPNDVYQNALVLAEVCDAINATDGAGANCHMSSMGCCALLVRAGYEAILQVGCRDRNRIAIQGDLLRSLDELRGFEGAATARYFQAWAAFLPEAFPFERRSTRPPLNPVNACISFGATLLYHEAVAFIHAHGLDPALGLLHTTEDGRWSLALDLIEPFRPVLVEALALDLFSHQMLDAGNFEPREGGIYLNDAGRKKFILQYERRMERQFMSECAGHRTTLRLQLEHQAVLFKAALDAPDRFEPFLMN